LSDCASLGAVRFVVVGQGAILEAVGSFSNLRYADSPKGKLATVSTDEPCFECHIRLREVKSIANVKINKFNKQLCVTRFLSEDGTTLLSAILHASPPPSSSTTTTPTTTTSNKEEAFDALILKWGEKLNLASPPISFSSSATPSSGVEADVIQNWLKLGDGASMPSVDVATSIVDRCEKSALQVGQAEGQLKAIVDWFNKHSSQDERIAALACRAFTHLAYDNADNKAKLGQAGACQAVLEAMSKHTSSSDVAVQGFVVLSSLAYDENNRILLGQAGASRVVLDALKRHADNNSLAAEKGLVAIRCLCWDSDLRFELCQNGACELILKVMNEEQYCAIPIVQMQGCLALGNLANENGVNKASMGQDGACETIVRVMKTEHGGLMYAALQALFSLANDDNNQVRFGRAGACPLVLEVMEKYGMYPQVVQFGCIAIYNLAWNTDNKRAFLDAGALEYLTRVSTDASLSEEARNEASNALTRL